MNAPAPSRCPACSYMPAGAQVICTNCGDDKRDPRIRTDCLYYRKACDCLLTGKCVEAI